MLDVRMIRVRDKQGRVRLAPADGASESDLMDLTIKAGSELRCKITVVRENPHNAWFHKLLQVVADTLDDPAWSQESLKLFLKKRCNLLDVHRFPNGEEVVKDKSTAFHAMDEVEFRDFTKRAVRVIIAELLPHVSRTDLLREVDAMLYGKAAA